MKQEINFNNYSRADNHYQIHIDQSFQQDQFVHQNHLICNYDQKTLKKEFVQKFTNYRKNQNTLNSTKNSFALFIRALLVNLMYFLSQLWLQIIPQAIRGRAIGQKSQHIMDKFNNLFFGNVFHWLLKLRQKRDNFCIIIEDHCLNNQTQKDENLFIFDQSPDSNQKLKFILRFETIALTSKDLQILQKDCHIDLAPILQDFRTYPILLFCRYNFVQQFSIVGSLQLTNLKQQDFEVILQQVKQQIRIIRQLQKQSKIQVFQGQKNQHHEVQLQQIASLTSNGRTQPIQVL